MRTRSYIRSRSGSRNGIALVTVLAFIVLLTILVVSFISFTRLNRLSTNSYSRQIQAQEIAQGGLQDILSDLRSEMLAGSTTNTAGSTTIYLPAPLNGTNFITAVPARIGYTAADYTNNPSAAGNTLLPTTLIRVSRASANYGGGFFSSVGTAPYNNYSVTINSRASQASTATPSVDGRSISAARWNKTLLLAPNTSAIPKPFTTTPPDWVYVTRTGSRTCTTADLKSNPSILYSNNVTQDYYAAAGTVPTPGNNPPVSPVVGRYAFVMYDEGALLDANVAGSPSTLIDNASATSVNVVTPLPLYTNSPSAAPPVLTSLTFNGKSYLNSADLSQLPGLTYGTTGTSSTGVSETAQNIIDNLVNWRNAGGIANVNSSYGNGLPGANFLGAVFSNALSGFLNFQSGDSPVLGRQDLINYFANLDSNINTTSATFSKALPYLGTFSRAVSAPTWSPTINSNQDPNYNPPKTPTAGLSTTAPVAYKTNATNYDQSRVVAAGQTNFDLANVRFANDGTIIHYPDDGTVSSATLQSSYSYAVKAGDPLLQNRFSLAKINWLSQSWAGQPDPGTTSPAYLGSNYPAAIQACFGLVWGAPGSTTTNSSTSTTTANGGNPCWNYVGSPVGSSGKSQAVTGVIETLDQVAKEGREPNFFELLKAAILSGSLGLGPGPAAFQNGANNAVESYNAPYDVKNPPGSNKALLVGAGGLFSHTFGSASSVPAPARIPDIQIIQIGANIIDQYDTDSYPTAIYFPYQGVGANDPVSGSLKNAIYGPVDMVYGDENLTLLSKMVSVICSPNPTGSNDANATGPSGSPSADDNTHSLEGWLQPELWNPHQAPGPGSTFGASSLGPNIPHNFEIRAYGSAMTYAQEKGNPPPPNPPPNNALASDMTVLPNGWTGGLAASTLNNWGVSNSNIQTYYPGISSAENPSSGVSEQAGTITFTDTSASSSFYANPLVLVQADTKGIPGLTNVTSALSGAASGTIPTNIAASTFPYYAVPSGTTYNHFVAFTAGLISETYNTPPFAPYYIGTLYDGNLAATCFPVTTNNPSGGASFALGWVDSSGSFHPYSFITGAFMQAYTTLYDDSGHGQDQRVGSASYFTCAGQLNWGLPDPRTGRFSLMFGSFVSGLIPVDSTIFPINSAGSVFTTAGIPTTGNFVSPQKVNTNISCFPEDWMINSVSPVSSTRSTVNGSDFRNQFPTGTYYADPDGVVRPADGIYSNVSTGDGVLTFTSNGAPSPSGSGPAGVPDTGNTQHGRRPIILNRPFRSVGELGYVFRDLPFKTLDFFSASSADAALLDVFSLTDESKVSNSQLSSVVAGQVNLSNAPVPVVQAILAGGSKKDSDSTYNLGAETGTSSSVLTNLAQSITNNLNQSSGPNPLLSRAALATQVNASLRYFGLDVNGNPAYISTAFVSSPDLGNKAYFEAPVRALADVTNTRTWNLLIDIIAQSGQMSSTATTLDNFVVQGERRYWLHIAIDRYTGKVVAQQLEPVYE